MTMQAIVLGSAAGGGVPQWNCRCLVCQLAWAGDPRVKPRTQSSLAVSVDGVNWLVVNASPDIRLQIAQTEALHPQAEPRHSPIAAVLLTNGEVDHTAGLLTLRDSHPFHLYATPAVLDGLAQNRMFDVLGSRFVSRRGIQLEHSFEPIGGLCVTVFATPGKVPLWVETESEIIGEATETTTGVMLEAVGRRFAYIPGCALITDEFRDRVAGADVLFFDGTVLHDDDLARAGVGQKTGWRMGHVAMTGENGSIASLADVPIGRRIFIHINNTNPVLIEDSDERRLVEEAGWTVAEDGMRVVL
jgi:pyrroloquinoline quinone biosynthesis protein B